MTEKTYTTENSSYTETELCISDSVGSFLLNFKDTSTMLCKLHEIPTMALLDIYRAVCNSITACLLASELPCSVLDILVALASFIAHEITRRQTEKQ